MIAPLRYFASCALAVIVTAGVAVAQTGGGVTISNAVSVTYSDGSVAYAAQSNTVQVTTAEISALVVSPKSTALNVQTDAFAANAQIVRVFTLTNSSNIADAYTVTAAGTSAGSIASLAFVAADGTTTPTSVNGARSPLVAPGASIAVAFTLATQGVPAGTSIAITLSARTTVTGTTNGLVSDSGETWAMPLAAAQFAGPSGAQSSILKSVDAVRSEAVAPGATVVYQITFENYGAMPAPNAVLSDAVPAGMAADPTSVTVNGRATAAQANGQTLTVALGTVAAQAVETIAFRATVGASQTLGTSYVNTASVSADGIAPVATTPASIIAGNADVVYDGYSGGRAPVAGALLALVDPATKVPVTLPAAAVAARTAASAGTRANPANANPFTTGSDGTYGFAIVPPAPGTTASYDLLISAPGYISRDIGIVLTPDASDLLYSVALTSKDGQPLAQAGGYALTSSNVMLPDVFGLLGNLPLFSTKPIAVTKTSDKPSGAPGDTIGYTVTVASTAASGLGAATVTDTLPVGLTYAAGTARVDGVAVEPVRSGNRLEWQLPALAANVTHTITYVCVILPNVTARTTLTNAVAVSGAIPGTMLSASGAANASIVTTSGIFSESAAITGRVFVDLLGDARFHSGDPPLSGVRLFLEDGESATTDVNGRFSFHGVRSGMHVLRLDETTLPPSARAFPDRRYDSTRSPVRLIHGVLDAGLLQDVSFAVQPVR
jgi:uncharacterized repeat protein (TIGR01451 family)